MKPPAVSLLLALATLAAASLAAEPAGDEICLSCHQKTAAANPDSPHLRSPVRCEACHGDGSRHAETGDAKAIRSFKGQPAAAVCMSCHQNQHVTEWKASRHAQVGVDCIDCHAAHALKDPQKACQACH